MTRLTFEPYSMPSASLGKPNPLPDIREAADLHASIPVDEQTITAEESRYMGWGRVNGILPYLIQDGYDRDKREHAWNAAVLENDHIRAVVLPELGGRLWSLVDKATGQELLHRNPVFQPCNLALRNAWISGGVEWNIGIIGHTPFTLDALFAERLALADGTPVLHMYQYERVRRLIYRVEMLLPDDSHHLFVRVRIDNSSMEDTAVYWWSNIAVDEREDVRVIVPAQRAYRWGYGGKVSKQPIPYMTLDWQKLSAASGKKGTLDLDISRTTQIPQAMDFFFDLPKGQRRWISAVGSDGYGFIQTSTDVLQGRKLFVWGMGAGGRNWQSFLARPGCAYLEIQAGLAHTQLEHLPMAGGRTISWMEAYGPIRTDREAVHGHDWDAACAAVERSLEEACPRQKLEALLKTAEEQLDGVPGEIAQTGANWAHVQRELLGDRFRDGGLSFPQSAMGQAERAWLELVRNRRLACPVPLAEPDSYQIGPEWERLLADTIAEGGSDHWYGQYQYGVTLAQAGKSEEAECAFERSFALARNPWALRCRAALSQMAGDEQKAANLLLEAVDMLPEPNLAKEALSALVQAGRSADAVRVYGALPPQVQAVGRLKVLLIEALLDLGDMERADELLGGSIELADVREGEIKLTDLWFRMMAMQRAGAAGVTDALLDEVKRECTPPVHLDFRMN